MKIEGLIKKLNENEFYIYGAGYVAGVLFRALKSKDLLNKFKGFVTTKGDSKKIDGYAVCACDTIDFESKIVILAVHESIKDEILALIGGCGYSECIWIYPYLFELMLGEPEKKLVSLLDVHSANCDNLAIAARYAAIEEFYGTRNDGYKIYLTVMEMHCSHETALKRLDRFKELIKYSETEYGSLPPISLLEDYKIIDGLHRVAILLYHQIDEAEVYVYPETLSQNDIHVTGVDITIEDLEKMNSQYTDVLIDINEHIKEKLMKR